MGRPDWAGPPKDKPSKGGKGGGDFVGRFTQLTDRLTETEQVAGTLVALESDWLAIQPEGETYVDLWPFDLEAYSIRIDMTDDEEEEDEEDAA